MNTALPQTILIAPMGDFDPRLLSAVGREIERVFHAPVCVRPLLDDWSFAFDAGREQFLVVRALGIADQELVHVLVHDEVHLGPAQHPRILRVGARGCGGDHGLDPPQHLLGATRLVPPATRAAECGLLAAGLLHLQDPLFDEAVRIVTETRRASISGVQRRLKIGYNRAARLIEEMERIGIVTPPESNGNREVLAPPPPED